MAHLQLTSLLPPSQPQRPCRTILQADAESKLAACEKQLLGCKERVSGLSTELEAASCGASAAGAGRRAVFEVWSARFVRGNGAAAMFTLNVPFATPTHLAGAAGPLGASCASPGPRLGAGSSVLDYIPRAEHLRILEVSRGGRERQGETRGQLRWAVRALRLPCNPAPAVACTRSPAMPAMQGRLAAKEGDMQLELASRVAQARRQEGVAHVPRRRRAPGGGAHPLCWGF